MYIPLMTIWRRLTFWLAYLLGRTPWDTNVTPPELVRTVKGPDALPPGRALDLGCGTGTNVIYLAKHGWEATGVDFIEKPIQAAREKAHKADVEAQFIQGDVTRLDSIDELEGSFDLTLDIGCLHSLQPEERKRYASGLVKRLRPGGTFLLYAWAPDPRQEGGSGVSPTRVEALFGPTLCVTRVERGRERGRTSIWYWLTKRQG